MSTGKIIAATAAFITVIGSYFLGKKSGFNEGKEEGRRDADAKYAEEIKKLQSELAAMLKDIAKREDFIVVAYAVGICCGNANGNLTVHKIETLDYLVVGIGEREILSQQAQGKISEMLINPPNLDTVWTLIKKHGFDTHKHKQLFTEIVAVIMSTEENKTQRDTDFIDAWNTLLAA